MPQKPNEVTLDEFEEILSNENPAFRTALKQERAIDALCEATFARLAALRQERGISLEELAYALDIPQMFVKRMEKNPGSVKLESFIRYAFEIGLQPKIEFVPFEAG